MASILLSKLKWDIAFGIYVSGGLLGDAALVYCGMNGADDLVACRSLIEERYLSEDVEEIRKVLDAVGKWQRLRKPINQWLVEYALNEWIEKINKTAGVAPSFDSVFEKYRSLRAEKDTPEERYEHYDCRKKWVQRFMDKWSSTRKSIITHEADSSAEITNKVFKNSTCKRTFTITFRTNFGNRFRTQF